MLHFSKPSKQAINRIIAAEKNRSFTYPEVGATRIGPNYAQNITDKTHYRFLEHTVVLGRGEETFERAKEAFKQWRMFDNLSWLQMCWPEKGITQGTTLAILGFTLGTWWVNTCRIIYVVDQSGPIEQFGFAYGTLPNNAVSGEECMMIEFNRSENQVYYHLRSFSIGNNVLARIASVHLWSLQKRFARESSAVLQDSIR